MNLVGGIPTPLKNDGVRQIASSSQPLGKITAMFNLLDHQLGTLRLADPKLGNCSTREKLAVKCVMLNFTRSWGFGIFRVYWVSKSKCIISSNLRAEGSSGKVLNVVIFVESVVHRSNWHSRETETVGNSRKQSGAARRDHAKIVNPPFFCKRKLSAPSHFFFESATGNSWKQLGLVPLTRQKKSYLKPVYKENEP